MKIITIGWDLSNIQKRKYKQPPDEAGGMIQKKNPPSHITNPSGKATQIIQRHRLNPGMTLVGPKDKVLKTLDLSFCLSLHTRMKVSKTTSAAWDTASEISKLMSRGFLNMLLLLRLWDWATVSSVSLLTS